MGPLPCCRYAGCDLPQAAGKSSGETLTNTAAPRSPRNISMSEHPVDKHDEATSANADQCSLLASRQLPAGARTLPVTASEDGIQATFVELPALAHTASGECILELENATGVKLRVQWKGVVMPDLTALTRGFWNHQP